METNASDDALLRRFIEALQEAIAGPQETTVDTDIDIYKIPLLTYEDRGNGIFYGYCKLWVKKSVNFSTA